MELIHNFEKLFIYESFLIAEQSAICVMPKAYLVWYARGICSSVLLSLDIFAQRHIIKYSLEAICSAYVCFDKIK